MSFHIFTAPAQPATRFVNTVETLKGRRRLTFRHPAHRVLYCQECDQRRWPSHLVVRVYYDMHTYHCAPGRGCAARRP